MMVQKKGKNAKRQTARPAMIISGKNHVEKHKDYSTLYLAGALLITLIIYFHSLQNQFTTLDDEQFVTKNEHITNLSQKNINYFFTHEHGGHFQPLVLLSYAIEYHYFQLKPKIYHFTNLFLHLCNVSLVFGLGFLLTRNKLGSLGIALIFALHPMNVETVAWIAQRNSILYPFFYLGSLILYLLYLKNPAKLKYYFLSLLVFLFSLMSKSAAVSLPLLLLLFDYFYRRKFNKKVIIEKIPFFILSVIFGIVAIISARHFGSLNQVENVYSVFNRFFMVCYAICFYFIKFLVPFHLSAMHFNPVITDGALPAEFYFALVIIIILALAIWKAGAFRRNLLFCLGFFFFSILMFLQILPIGNTIVSERYVYLPYIGLMLLPVFYIEGFRQKNKAAFSKFKQYFAAGFIVIAVIFGIITYNRINVFQNGKTLFADIIEKTPENEFGYYGMGGALMLENNYSEALKFFDKSIAIRSDYVDALNNRGTVRHHLGDFKGALEDYNKTISLKPDYSDAYYNRGISLSCLGRFKEAINDYDKAIQLNSEKLDIWGNRGVAKFNIHDYNGAIADYNKASEINPDDPMVYYNRGIAENAAGNFNSALSDYNRAIELKNDFPDLYLNRGVVKAALKDYSGAEADYTQTINLKPDYAKAFFNRGIARWYLQKKKDACSDWQQALALGDTEAKGILNNYCK